MSCQVGKVLRHEPKSDASYTKFEPQNSEYKSYKIIMYCVTFLSIIPSSLYANLIIVIYKIQ